MIKNFLQVFFLFLMLFALAGCTQSTVNSTPSDAIPVVVTFDAMKEFVEAVGGDHVQVTKLIPDGMEAHDFEPKGKDMAVLSDARIFVYNGLGMETWVEETLASLENPSLLVVEAGHGADVIELESHEETSEEGHDHEGVDPHLWLSISGAKYELGQIKEALIIADPENKSAYEANYANYVAQLEEIYQTYQTRLSGLANKNFVTGHAAFAYLCRDFGLVQKSVSDVFAEGESSAKKLMELIDYAKTNQITTIFSEEMASPEISQTLADEVGAKVETIYTMESGEDGKTYLERMTSNLEKIASSLK